MITILNLSQVLREIEYLRIRMLVAVSFIAQDEEMYNKFVEHTKWLDEQHRVSN